MSLILFLVVLFILVLVHELGHFAVAKFFGIRVDEFAIGFPPRLFSRKRGETEYSINALPLGGYVKIYGEDPTQEHLDGPDSARSFVNKHRLIQAAVLVAGVAMNVLLAWALFVGGYLVGMPTAVDESNIDRVENVRLLVTNVLPESPAALGLKASDEIVGIRAPDGDTVEGTLTPESLAGFIGARENEKLTLSIVRRSETVETTITPQRNVLPGEPERVATGFTMSLAGIERLNPIDAVVEGSTMTWYMLRDVAVGLWDLVYDAVRGEAELAQLSGPVGIVGLVGDAASLGIAYLITFTAFISLNLAVINLLPFPALDGGRLLFVGIEAVTRRRIKPVVANTLNQIGFVLLLTLMAVVTVHDVLKLV